MKHSLPQNVIWALKNGRLNWYSHVAKEISDEANIANNPLTRGHNDGRDAFRHAYISALVAYRYGQTAAEYAGDLNEQKNGAENPVGEEWMDTFNNRVGRDIAKKVKETGGSEQDLKDVLARAMADGHLVLTPFDPRRTLDQGKSLEEAKKDSEALIQQEMQRELKGIVQSDMSAAEKQNARYKLAQKYREYENQRQKAVEKAEVTVNKAHGAAGEVQVEGYSRSTGDVKSHTRSKPDGDLSNNRSR